LGKGSKDRKGTYREWWTMEGRKGRVAYQHFVFSTFSLGTHNSHLWQFENANLTLRISILVLIGFLMDTQNNE